MYKVLFDVVYQGESKSKSFTHHPLKLKTRLRDANLYLAHLDETHGELDKTLVCNDLYLEQVDL